MVTTTDGNGCAAPTQVNVSNIGAPTLTLVGSNALCFNEASGSIVSAANGGTPPYAYSWSNGTSNENAQNLLAGTYTLTMTDAASCIVIQSLVITEPDVLYGLSAYLNVSTSSSCDGEATINAFGGTGAYTYLWDDPGTQTTATATGMCLGTYNVTLTDANGCEYNLAVYVDSIVMGILMPDVNFAIAIYPNPTSGKVIVSWELSTTDDVLVNIIGLDGQQLYSEMVTAKVGNTHQLDLSGLAKGIYFVQVIAKDAVVTKKIVLH